MTRKQLRRVLIKPTPDATVTLHEGDSFEILDTIVDKSVQAVIIDPPLMPLSVTRIASHRPATIRFLLGK